MKLYWLRLRFWFWDHVRLGLQWAHDAVERREHRRWTKAVFALKDHERELEQRRIRVRLKEKYGIRANDSDA